MLKAARKRIAQSMPEMMSEVSPVPSGESARIEMRRAPGAMPWKVRKAAGSLDANPLPLSMPATCVPWPK